MCKTADTRDCPAPPGTGSWALINQSAIRRRRRAHNAPPCVAQEDEQQQGARPRPLPAPPLLPLGLPARRPARYRPALHQRQGFDGPRCRPAIGVHVALGALQVAAGEGCGRVGAGVRATVGDEGSSVPWAVGGAAAAGWRGGQQRCQRAAAASPALCRRRRPPGPLPSLSRAS